MTFKVKVPAKCILAGEHLILERGYAIVAPLHRYHLTLSYEPHTIKTKYTISAEGNNSLGIILWPAICKAYELLQKDHNKITGFFNIKSTIIPCGGIGFSAALCVAITEWLIYQGLLSRSELFQFARQLEDMFHKRSSGVDIAGVTAKNIIKYYSNSEIIEMSISWQPLLYISSSDETSFSGPCVKKVLELKKENPAKAEAIYDKMLQAVILINNALENKNDASLDILARGLTMGNECFYEWDLISPQLHDHIELLKQHALACKIIGAGFGGHVLSLWAESPPVNFPIKLYRLSLSQ
ncbi:mevalonate kinase family protein [Legionella fallonii]|uniref:Putataive Mevalonate kinase n=1 Tax=Legionella fallonii LLAP-10 TaxID=1212491 RepID=A0A098G2C2_9GAMM|nr:mevalonate kinase [Legionella fallonii]CEG56627.1 putataive Mevalonate kinase [Legionella fallonii LLAP-10]